ncbi:MAG TPA: ABC transporter permease subunit [Mycobacteriales bacterium]|nr:ABC transporter permease subunit [Mycobacteriales bacterium]
MTPQGIATVARQEFRLRIRAGRWRWLLAAFFLVLLAFTALLRAGLSNLPPEELPYKGTVIYGGLMLFVLGLALLVVPALAAQSVNGDRERGTLAVLQVTRLSAGDIAVGKLAAAWGTALVFLALTAPLVGYAMTQDGVPLGRVVVVTVVLALLLGTVCALALFLSSVLSRTTTSGVLAYLTVFALTIGTLIVFGLATAVTAERYTVTFEVPCPMEPPPGEPFPPAPDPSVGPPEVCGTDTYETSRSRTDRTWWLLAPNPFVVLADAAPRLPEPAPGDVQVGPRAADLDPLGQIGRQVRDLRRTPTPVQTEQPLEPQPLEVHEAGGADPVWPAGLAANVVLGGAALLLTTRRLRTPTRSLPKGQRVA